MYKSATVLVFIAPVLNKGFCRLFYEPNHFRLVFFSRMNQNRRSFSWNGILGKAWLLFYSSVVVMGKDWKAEKVNAPTTCAISAGHMSENAARLSRVSVKEIKWRKINGTMTKNGKRNVQMALPQFVFCIYLPAVSPFEYLSPAHEKVYTTGTAQVVETNDNDERNVSICRGFRIEQTRNNNQWPRASKNKYRCTVWVAAG